MKKTLVLSGMLALSELDMACGGGDTGTQNNANRMNTNMGNTGNMNTGNMNNGNMNT